MTPIDPASPASPDPRPPMAPPYVDEDPNLALVEQGLNQAENELRDVVADDYEAAARTGDDPDAELDDIEFSDTDDASSAPELSAMHVEVVPLDEEIEEEEES